MSNLSRREFLERSMMAAAAASLPATPLLANAGPERRAGPNDVLRIATVGVKVASRPDQEIAGPTIWLCSSRGFQCDTGPTSPKP